MCVAVHAARSAAIDCSDCFVCDAVNGKHIQRTTWLLPFCHSLEKKRLSFRSLSAFGFCVSETCIHAEYDPLPAQTKKTV